MPGHSALQAFVQKTRCFLKLPVAGALPELSFQITTLAAANLLFWLNQAGQAAAGTQQHSLPQTLPQDGLNCTWLSFIPMFKASSKLTIAIMQILHFET